MSPNSPPSTGTPDKIATVLGFDYGDKRIGVAVGQTVTKTASPLLILRAHGGAPRWSEVTALLREWSPDALVVGVPTHMDDSEQPLTRKAVAFGRKLRERYRLPVFGADERLTTREARSLDGAAKKRHADDIAARIILQSWLNDPQRHAIPPID